MCRTYKHLLRWTKTVLSSQTCWFYGMICRDLRPYQRFWMLSGLCLFQWQRSRRWRSCRCHWRTAHVCWSAEIWWLCPLVSSVRSATDAIPNSTPRETPERNWNWWQVGESLNQPYMKVNKNETSSWRHWRNTTESSLYSLVSNVKDHNEWFCPLLLVKPISENL